MKQVITALGGTLALTGAAFAVENKTRPGTSSNSPGHEMQDKGSPGASAHAPGHEM